MNNRKEIILLILLMIFYSFVNYFWLSENNYRPYDEYWYLYEAKIFKYPSFQNSTGFDANLLKSRPLLPFLASVVFPIFGVNEDFATMMNIPFLFILILSTYKIGEKIFNKTAGFLAAFLVSMYPIIFGLSRHFGSDIALISLITLSMYFLLSSEKFRNKKYSILLGITCLVGMLVSIFFIVYFIVPLVYLIFASFRKNTEKKRIFNFTIFFLLSFFIPIFFYLYKNFLTRFYLSSLFFEHLS